MIADSKLKYICGMWFGIFGILGIALAFNSTNLVYAYPKVEISPTCGPPDFNVMIHATGFLANSNVAWKLVNYHGNAPLTGYFQTDSNGEIRDLTTIDDVSEGKYMLLFGEDADNDGIFDSKSELAYANIRIPCSE